MPRFSCFLMTLFLAACSTGPDLHIPEGMVQLELYEIVHESNPLWDPVERTVTDVRLLQGRRVADDRYEFDADYEVLCLSKREPISASELQRMGDSMRSQGREPEWKQMEARRKAAEQYLAGRVADMKPGEKRRFRDTFVLVRIDQSWIPEAMAERFRANRAAATR